MGKAFAFLRKTCYLSNTVNLDQLKTILPLTSPDHVIAGNRKNTTHEQYLEQVEEYKNTFRDTSLRKAILSRIISVPSAVGENIPDFFNQLCTTYSSAFVYVLHLPGEQFWAGATPELLLKEVQQIAKTVSLAGTLPYTDDQFQNYNWGKKEIEEQAMVSDYVRNTLSTLNSNRFTENGPMTIKAGQVVHLQTTYTFPLQIEWSKLVKSLHPTPAICGIPKDLATQLITQIEEHPRDYYSGYLGPINANKSTQLFVNLRCTHIQDGQAHLFVGGGLTADSEAVAEWEETNNKATTLLNVLNQFSQR